MTISEAKKIIDMCEDITTKSDGSAKTYVNKEYVMQILDMVDIIPLDLQPGTDKGNLPVWPPTWPQVWYKNDSDTGFEKVPWWVWYKGQYDFTCNGASTGSKPDDNTTVAMTPENLTKFAESYSNPKDYKNTSIENSTDVSPKRTDFIDDFKPCTN